MENKEPVVFEIIALGRYFATLSSTLEYINPDPKFTCYVSIHLEEGYKNEKYKIELLCPSCTRFKIVHPECTSADLENPQKTEELLERSLVAVSEVIQWNKAKDSAQTISKYARQIGRIDIKHCFVYTGTTLKLFWHNQALNENGMLINMVRNFFPANWRVINGPNQNPTPYPVRRFLNITDLINLGFYSEAFISAFSFLDDTIQEVVKKGLEQKGLDTKEQRSLLMAIKEERLKNYLTIIPRLLQWESLKEVKPELFNKLMKVNKMRNNIVHNGHLVSRDEVYEGLNTILLVIVWLQKNPFGYHIHLGKTFPPVEVVFHRKSNEEE